MGTLYNTDFVSLVVMCFVFLAVDCIYFNFSKAGGPFVFFQLHETSSDAPWVSPRPNERLRRETLYRFRQRRAMMPCTLAARIEHCLCGFSRLGTWCSCDSKYDIDEVTYCDWYGGVLLCSVQCQALASL